MKPEVCNVCRFLLRTTDAERTLYCSEFCADTTLADKEGFRKLQPGDFGLYPCAECGCIVEDTYVKDGICGDCSPIRLLRGCLGELVEPSALANEVRGYINAHSLKGA